MIIKLQLKKLLVPVAALLLALTLVLATAAPAFAGTPEPAKPVAGIGKVTNAELTGMLLRERAWYDTQFIIIRESTVLATLFQSLIDDQITKGADVTILETALSAFNQEIAIAEASRVNTVNILNKNLGFNGYFIVIDRVAAGQTILDAKESLKGTHMRLTQAMLDLERSYHTWKQRKQK